MLRLGDFSFRRARGVAVAGLLALSIVTRFFSFGEPQETVFDEVYFGKFVAAYASHEYFFDIHPPFGKLLIAGTAWLSGTVPMSGFDAIGTRYVENQHIALRLLPTIAGALLPVVLFLLALELGARFRFAVLVGFLAVVDNGLLVQSRFILLDSLMLCFGFLSWLVYMRFRHSGWIGYMVLGGVLAGAAVSIKWTALTFVALPIAWEGYSRIARQYRKPDLKGLFPLVLFVMGVGVVYLGSFATHFSLLSGSGEGDAFMSREFRRDLEGSDVYLEPGETLSFWEKFIELNAVMYTSNRTVDTHPYGSQWYEWPLMMRSVYYWHGQDRYIYFLGNPAVWWVGTAAVVSGAGVLLYDAVSQRRNTIRRTGKKPKRLQSPSTLGLLLGFYVLNLVPFALIDRVMFLYHYLVAMLVSIVAIPFVIERLPKRWHPVVGGSIALIALTGFFFFAPISYGLAISQGELQWRMWLSGWR